MLKLTTITFTLIAALSFGASTADAKSLSGNHAPQPTSVSVPMCQDGSFADGRCPPPGPQLNFGIGGNYCTNGHRTNCTPRDATIPDCKGGSQTIYGTTHECL